MSKINFSELECILIIIVILFLGISLGILYEQSDDLDKAQLNFERGINYSIRYDLKDTYRDKYYECYEELFEITSNNNIRNILATNYNISDCTNETFNTLCYDVDYDTVSFVIPSETPSNKNEVENER